VFVKAHPFTPQTSMDCSTQSWNVSLHAYDRDVCSQRACVPCTHILANMVIQGATGDISE